MLLMMAPAVSIAVLPISKTQFRPASSGTGKASGFLVVRSSVLLAALLLALCASTRAQLPPYCADQNVTFGTTTQKSDVDTAKLTLYGPNFGGGSCYMELTASKQILQSQPGKPNDYINIYLYLSCYDYSQYPKVSFYDATYIATDTSGVNIDAKKKKASASIVGDLHLEYFTGSPGTPTPPQTASVSVQGSADGEESNVSKCSGENLFTTECAVVVDTFTKTSTGGGSATFSGTVFLGGTPYDVGGAPYTNGYILHDYRSSKRVLALA